MVCTVARISGLTYHSSVDATWETFWQYMSASIGLTLTSVAAFRSLFLSHHVSHRQQETSDFEALRLLFAKVKQALRRTFSVQSWQSMAWYTNVGDTSQDPDASRDVDLGTIERGTITGLRTFIREYRRTPATASELMYSHISEEVVDHRETRSLPDNPALGELAGNSRHEKVSTNDSSGRHEKILAHSDSRRHDKILAHKESRRHDKMLNSQESRKRDKILIRQETDTQEVALSEDYRGKSEAMVTRPAKVRDSTSRHGQSSAFVTGDSDFDDGSRWHSSNAKGKVRPAAKVGIMSKMTCGGLVFSAGFKAERYREEG